MIMSIKGKWPDGVKIDQKKRGGDTFSGNGRGGNIIWGEFQSVFHTFLLWENDFKNKMP